MKTVCVFEISTFKFFKKQSLIQNKKNFKTGTIYALYWYFLARIWKITIVTFDASTLQFYKNQVFVKNKKTSNLRPKLPYLGSLGQQSWKTILMKAALSNLSECKVKSWKIKNHSIRDQKCRIWVYLEWNVLAYLK